MVDFASVQRRLAAAGYDVGAADAGYQGEFQLLSDDGTTAAYPTRIHAFFRRGKDRKTDLVEGLAHEALQARGCRCLGMPVRLRSYHPAGSTNSDPIKGAVLRRMSIGWDSTSRKVEAFALQDVAAHHRSLYQSEEWLLCGLRRARHFSLRAMAVWREWFDRAGVLCCGYGSKARRTHYRAQRQQLGLRAAKLHLGQQSGPRTQSPRGEANRISGRDLDRSRMVGANRNPVFHPHSSASQVERRARADYSATEEIGHRAPFWRSA